MKMSSDLRLRAGQALGHYQLVRMLDHRRPVEVWQGQHISVPIQVALKVLPRDGQEEEEYQHVERRLQNEALVLADLHHQHIVTLRDYLRGRNFHALVLEYAPYGSMPRYHGSGRKLPLALIRLYIWQIGHALTVLHGRGLLHRDVKPSNILLLSPRHALLADFGLALYASVLTAQQRPHQGGTPAYMAPEQQRGYPCPASDQYGLATSVYEWLTGHRPFSGETGQRMSRREHLEPLPVRILRPELPAAVDEILRIALHPDPTRRYPSVLDFARDFVEVTRTSRPPLVRRMPYDRGTRGREAAPPAHLPRLRETGEHQALCLPALSPRLAAL
ncbi:MAG TPA: serine/threonine-protein kinase [Ktedonobacteraceae bacterium]|jgi:serine/threonine protein kinase|nr:serine/threonine-protein kinase [Ktedonobacteraceae bacterium]